ncbi:NUDIX domain-containing protein [Candidatus Woesearchaeota archaeon]|nr:NUDIX domain-containing protein [Candidatus Woesearchaeota archaeon]
MKETSAGAIIFRIDDMSKKPRYLLLHYGAGHWDFVKGHIEGSETEEETLLREAKEESGLTDLKLISGFRHKISYFYKKDGKTVAKDVIFLLAKTAAAEKDVKLSFEHSDYLWLEFAAAVKKVTYESSKKVLEKADRFVKGYSKQKRLRFD